MLPVDEDIEPIGVLGEVLLFLFFPSLQAPCLLLESEEQLFAELVLVVEQFLDDHLLSASDLDDHLLDALHTEFGSFFVSRIDVEEEDPPGQGAVVLEKIDQMTEFGFLVFHALPLPSLQLSKPYPSQFPANLPLDQYGGIRRD